VISWKAFLSERTFGEKDSGRKKWRRKNDVEFAEE
jgi:hypothetical protein